MTEKACLKAIRHAELRFILSVLVEHRRVVYNVVAVRNVLPFSLENVTRAIPLSLEQLLQKGQQKLHSLYHWNS